MSACIVCRDCGARHEMSSRDQHLGDQVGQCERCSDAENNASDEALREDGRVEAVKAIAAWLRDYMGRDVVMNGNALRAIAADIEKGAWRK